jgi:hypothetical protein
VKDALELSVGNIFRWILGFIGANSELPHSLVVPLESRGMIFLKVSVSLSENPKHGTDELGKSGWQFW